MNAEVRKLRDELEYEREAKLLLQLKLHDVWEWASQKHIETCRESSVFLEVIDKMRTREYLITDGLAVAYDKVRAAEKRAAARKAKKVKKSS